MSWINIFYCVGNNYITCKKALILLLFPHVTIFFFKLTCLKYFTCEWYIINNYYFLNSKPSGIKAYSYLHCVLLIAGVHMPIAENLPANAGGRARCCVRRPPERRKLTTSCLTKSYMDKGFLWRQSAASKSPTCNSSHLKHSILNLSSKMFGNFEN